MDVCVRNSRDIVFNVRKVYLTCDFNSKLCSRDISKELNTNKETIERLIVECKGKIDKAGVISFRNVKLANDFENRLKEQFVDVLTLKTIMDEETINFIYAFYDKPGFWDFIEGFWSVVLLIAFTVSIVKLLYTGGKLLIMILKGGN